MLENALVLLQNYRPYPFTLNKVFLYFMLDEKQTQVSAKMYFSPVQKGKKCDLILDGKEIALQSISLDNQDLPENLYTLGEDTLTVDASAIANKAHFTLDITVHIHPATNFALEGLYKSGPMLCTQCEAEGFRRIMYFPDRPDVMTIFEVSIKGDIQQFPVMLSNGNMIADTLHAGMRTVVWHDPHRKPCYLFALVAGQLARVEDGFITSSGKEVALHMYVESHNLDKCQHALESLKKAMSWDEKTYAREYDLDLFQIVATDDFNSGAMENKGLNIFNSECVLADPQTATDDDYLTIEGIVAHEYFHNWSGNRVTLRDWFQLSLKEGFTVFRENQYIADTHSAATRRVEEASLIQTLQFAEDASPTSHPVRPNTYQQIRNFYTLTVYEKGAEVVRMLQTLIGKEAFSRGAQLYFERYDGQAVCVEDFVDSMKEVSGYDFNQFMHWYTQAGTPQVSLAIEYHQQSRCCDLHFSQSIAGDDHAQPLVIPIDIALFRSNGQRFVAPSLLCLTKQQQTFRVENIDEMPIPSLLRGFSAPVLLDYNYSDEQLRMLITHERDGYSRWNAAQKYKVNALLGAIDAWPEENTTCVAQFSSLFTLLQQSALACVSNDNTDEQALLFMLMNVPSYTYLCEQQSTIAVTATWQCRSRVLASLGQQLAGFWQQLADNYYPNEAYQVTFAEITKRRLYLQAKSYLAHGVDTLDDSHRQSYEQASNLTDRIASLEILAWHKDTSYRNWALQDFLTSAGNNATLINRWFECQATIPESATLALVQRLTEHPLFDWHNPNKMRSLLGVFAHRNPLAFHCEQGYAFYVDILLRIDGYNPQMASRLATPLFRWKRYAPKQAEAMFAQLERIANNNISDDLREGVHKSLVV